MPRVPRQLRFRWNTRKFCRLVNFSLSIQHLLSIDLHDCLTRVNSGVYCTRQCETENGEGNWSGKVSRIYNYFWDRFFVVVVVFLFILFLFVFFPVSINSPRSLCKRLSFLLKKEREPRPRPHAFRYFWKRKFFFLLKMYASTRCVFKWFVLLFIFPFNTKTLKRCNHSRIPYRGCAVRWMTSGHSREDLCFRASTWRRQFCVFIRLHSAEDCFRKPASLHWCPKLKHPLPVNRRIKQRENIWIRVDGALDRSLLIDVCPLNTNYKTCSVIKPSLKNEK